MSGGSHNYICYSIDEYLVGHMRDLELNDLMKDVSEIAHDLEWFESGDTCEETYRESVAKFKKKWFGTSRNTRLKGYIDSACDSLRNDLYEMIGERKEE